MLSESFIDHLAAGLAEIREQGLYKTERVIAGAQGTRIRLENGRTALNFCANNYLGLAGDPALAEAAARAMREWGFGLASVRFICGTQALHRRLERRMSDFLGTEDCLLYSSCFDANGGLMETLLDERDAVISDELNHASIIDGVRLCKARRLRYRHLADLERALKDAAGARFRLICTDGVFSMDGEIADLAAISDLAETHDALLMVDDSHATGYIGPGGRGTAWLCGVHGRVDIVTTTFGKALGGASGGCTAARREIVEMLRQRSRPYLFSNTLAPAVAGGVLAALDRLEQEPGLIERVHANAARFKAAIVDLGYEIVRGDTAIVPVMLRDERLAVRLAERLLELGVYVVAFSYPVVPRGTARIRVQLSAAHSQEDIDRCLDAFARAGRELGLIGVVHGGESGYH